MSILSGYKKVKDYIKTSSGYQLLSRWTSSQTVHFDDNKTAQTKVGAINGIIKDKASLSTVTDSSFAAGAVAVKDALADVNSKLNAQFRTATKSYTITPSAAKSVINLSFDLSDIILDGYSASDIIVTSVNYTGSHEYQQVTITDANSQLTGTARIMAETTVEFSIRFTVLLYKKSAFNI